MQYTLQTARSKDKTGLMRVLGILAQNIRGHPFEDAFLHSLVTGLAGMKDDFEAEDFCTAVFDEFFFTCINVDNVVRHLIRLLWWVHTKLPPARLETLLKVRLDRILLFVFLSCISDNCSCISVQVAEPTTGSEAVVAVYEALKERVEQSNNTSMEVSASEEPTAPF